MPPSPRSSQRATEYLEVLYSLLYPVGEFRPSEAAKPIAARVAARLGVSRPSASETLQRLNDQGYIERATSHALALTPKGLEVAEQAIRSTRVIERFLADALGYDPAQVHELALQVRDGFTPEMVDRLHAHLGSPERCPHGWLLGAAAERDEADGLARLVDLASGARGAIVGVVETDADLVEWLFSAGLTPGSDVTIVSVESAAGLRTVEVGGNALVVADQAARQVFLQTA
ncbi:MAG: metal-dependent transcriptional regulator [Patulibacter minatonensis]